MNHCQYGQHGFPNNDWHKYLEDVIARDEKGVKVLASTPSAFRGGGGGSGGGGGGGGGAVDWNDEPDIIERKPESKPASYTGSKSKVGNGPESSTRSKAESEPETKAESRIMTSGAPLSTCTPLIDG